MTRTKIIVGITVAIASLVSVHQILAGGTSTSVPMHDCAGGNQIPVYNTPTGQPQMGYYSSSTNAEFLMPWSATSSNVGTPLTQATLTGYNYYEQCHDSSGNTYNFPVTQAQWNIYEQGSGWGATPTATSGTPTVN